MLTRLERSLREEWKQGGREEVLEELQKAGVSVEAAEQLTRETQSSLCFYIRFGPLRKLDSQDRVALKGMLTSIYQKYIVRLEPGSAG